MSLDSLSANPRYALLSEQILNARGEDISIDIAGTERLHTTADSIVPEAACTSTQLHVQTSPDQFAAYWNASQAIAARAAGGGRQLAVPAGQGAVARDPDPAVRAGHRHPQRGAQGPGRAAAGVVRGAVDHLGVRPVRGERPLLPGAAADRPTTRTRWQVLEAGGTPNLSELRLHNGTIYRWNRPVYDISRRRAAPAGREPTARRRPDRRRHDGERRVLLRAGPRARRERATALVADVVQRRRGELPRGRPAGHRGPALLAGRRPGVGHRAGAAPAAARRPAGARVVGRRRRRPATGCSASSSSAA